MLIIGHRGSGGTEPENTIRSFIKAQEVGADIIEFDVRQSKDGELVVIHDHDLLRLFGDPRAIKDMTLEEIKRVSRERDREIPTFDETLAVMDRDIYIDIKVHGIEEKIVSKIKNFPHKVLISCFYPEVLKKIRNLDGNVRLALIIPLKRFHLITIANFLTRKLNLYAVHPRNIIVVFPLIALLRLSGRKIYVWTVNNEREYIRMRKLRVDGIFTDYPELMKYYEQNSSI
jgi:glycerophosphoryl diester phosphodiesterase